MTGVEGDAMLQRRTGVWWDLNTCPVPAGVEPGRVLGCIESALEKEVGRGSEVHIYAIGNLEYISRDLLEHISSSGIVLMHAPCGGHDLLRFLKEWSKLNPPPATIMLISCDHSMVNPGILRLAGYTTAYCVYPKGRPVTLDHDDHKLVVKEFVWETLLHDNNNTSCETKIDDEPLCICDICSDTFEICGEFVTHLKSQEHKNELFDIVPRESTYGKPKYFCQVCNYPGYDQDNMDLHNQSEEHSLKLKNLEDCESSKRNPQVDLFHDRNKKQRGKQAEE